SQDLADDSLRLVRFSLSLQCGRKEMERSDGMCVLRSEERSTHCVRRIEERIRCREVSSIQRESTQIVQTLGQIRVRRIEKCLADGQTFSKQRVGGIIIAPGNPQQCQVVETPGKLVLV